VSLALLLLGLAAAPSSQDAAEAARFQPTIVKLEHRDGLELWTVRAHEASVQALLERVAELSGRTVDSTTAVEGAPLITISLERRPLAQVLEFALGSAGLLVDLDGARIRVRGDRPGDETPDQRAGLAAVAWARAAASHPDHPAASMARLAQGELEELRGHGEAARRRYLDLLALSPASGAAGEAYLRAGRLAAERGDWSEASEHFRSLANLPGADEYRAVARVELARSTLRLGDARGALYILDALETSHPCWERTERTARTLIRVEALLEDGRFQDACLELEARSDDLDPLGAVELPRLRARALEGAGLFDEAARAWLLVARDAEGPSRVSAYQEAARLAEATSDPMVVLYIAREARAAGFAASVGAAESRAKIALGMESAPRDPSPRASARLEQAERWLERHELERASDELEVLFEAREALELAPDERARLAVAWVRCLAAHRGVEAATDVARAERTHVAPGAPRALLDRGVALLLEAYGLYERAADAYQGEY